ncbi:MAG: hypothetical protein VKJ02_12055 [Snowella sp.]|nr:hypothetical protein [Snowella sp.]
MTLSLTWTPDDPILLTNLVKMAEQKGETIESILSEAVKLYLENQHTVSVNTQHDPLIGLFQGSPNLATESEEILQKEIGIL